MLRVPWVDDSQASGFKGAGVSRCNNQTVAFGRSGNVAVRGSNSVALRSRTGTKHCIGFGVAVPIMLLAAQNLRAEGLSLGSHVYDMGLAL
jgi:hypothetical protein